MSAPVQPPLAVVVRDAVAADMDQVQAIYSFYVTRTAASFEEEPPSVDEMRRRLAATLERGLPFLVAEEKGEVLGYTYAGPFRSRSAYRYTVEDSIYVAPFVTRRGIGGTLLQALIDRCTALGYRQMIAVIGDSANQGSIGLHRSLGFRQEGVLRGVGLKFGRWVDRLLRSADI
ncbi:MAG: N-acetyltransferase family protein [Pseudomonadota bacterium]